MNFEIQEFCLNKACKQVKTSYIKKVQVHLNHTNVQITMNIYAHITPEAKENVIQKYEEYLNI